MSIDIETIFLIPGSFLYLIIGAICGILFQRSRIQRGAYSSYTKPSDLQQQFIWFAIMGIIFLPLFAAYLVAWGILGKMKVEFKEKES